LEQLVEETTDTAMTKNSPECHQVHWPDRNAVPIQPCGFGAKQDSNTLILERRYWGHFSCLELEDLFHPQLEETTKVPTVFATTSVCCWQRRPCGFGANQGSVDSEDKIGPVLPGIERRSVWGGSNESNFKKLEKWDQAQL
jgi:hypothetical protein